MKNDNSKKKVDVSNDDEDYNEFKKKFLDVFLKKRMLKDDEKVGEIAKRQGLINSGKDHHLKQTNKVTGSDPSPGLINHGKDNSNEQKNSVKVEGEQKKKEEVQSRLNKLYGELRKETADRVDSERNRRERLLRVKQDLVGLLNKLQTSRDDSTFSYHHGEFDRVIAEENKKDSEVVDSEKNKKESKLAVVESLVRELRQLESNKKQEELKKKEEEKTSESMKRVENIFMEAFREELLKRKRTEHEEEIRRKKVEEEEKERERELELKKEAAKERIGESSSGRQMLLKLMGELDKRILDEKSKVEEADKKKKKTVQRHEVNTVRKQSSVEKELDSILAELSNEVSKKDETGATSKNKRNAAIEKAFEGFNIANDSKARP